MAFDNQFETIKQHDDYPNKWMRVTHFGKKPITHHAKRVPTAKGVKPKEIRAPIDRQTAPIEQSVKLQDTETDIALQDAFETTDKALPEEGDDPSSTLGNESEDGPIDPPGDPGGRWLSRHKPTKRLLESGHLGRVYTASYEEEYDGTKEYQIQREMNNPIAFAAKSNPDDFIISRP